MTFQPRGRTHFWIGFWMVFYCRQTLVAFKYLDLQSSKGMAILFFSSFCQGLYPLWPVRVFQKSRLDMKRVFLTTIKLIYIQKSLLPYPDEFILCSKFLVTANPVAMGFDEIRLVFYVQVFHGMLMMAAVINFRFEILAFHEKAINHLLRSSWKHWLRKKWIWLIQAIRLEKTKFFKPLESKEKWKNIVF